VVLNDAESVTTTMLPMEILHLSEDADAPAEIPRDLPGPTPLKLGNLIGKSLAEVERLLIEETVFQNQGSVTRAARVLDVSPSTLYRKRKSWGR